MPKTSAACGTVIKTGTSSKFLYIFITYFKKGETFCNCFSNVICVFIIYTKYMNKSYLKYSFDH